MTVRILRGDCLDVLRTLPADSVHCCVTSPPYYGLRDYGVAGQIGLEATPEEFVAKMVEVFRLVRRVLRSDGCVFLNLGDSYNGTKVGNTNAGASSGLRSDGRDEASRRRSNAIQAANCASMQFRKEAAVGLASKQLLMMPARVALALQADGWWLRSDIIWHKPNPMPESCRDRPTSAHEHVFLLTKSPRYFYDIDAVREPIKESSIARLTQPNVLSQPGGPKDSGEGNRSHRKALRNQAEKLIAAEKWKDRFEGWAEWDTSQGRNLRNVWTIATAPYSDAHFATFPPELAERCIKAGTSERGCCSACGAPWVRQVERVNGTRYGDGGEAAAARLSGGLAAGQATRMGDPTMATTGWSASCQCQANYDCNGLGCGHQPCVCIGLNPCTVLDPFGGAGTVGLVADRLQRDAVLIELNPAYAEMAERRLHRDAGLFAEVATA
jgi:DNA modification methylase